MKSGAGVVRALLCWVTLVVGGCGSRAGAGGRSDAGGSADTGGGGGGAGADAGGPADGAQSAVSDFFAQYTVAYCGYLVVCGDEPDVATCIATWQVFSPWYPPQVLKDVASGTVIFDATMARACVASLDNPACTRTWYAGCADKMARACDGVFTGTLPVGSDCLLDVECAGDTYCQPTETTCSTADTCCTGTCVAEPDTPIPLNARCPTPNDDLSACVSGSYCAAGPNGTATCQPLITTVGAACLGLRQCAPPLYCKHDPMTVSGVCAQPSPPGGACHPSADEQSLSCESMLTYCNVSTATCDAFVTVGGSCGVTSSCTTDTTCVATAPGTCVLLHGLGEACSPQGAPCLGTLVCDPTTTTCVQRSAPGCG